MTPTFYFFSRRTVAVFAVLLLWVFNVALIANFLGIMEYNPILTYILCILGALLYPAYIKSRPVDETSTDKIIYYITLISILVLTSLLVFNIYYAK